MPKRQALSLISLLILGILSTVTVSAQTTSAVFSRNLTFGDFGDDVSALQSYLIANSFLAIPAPTGRFGSLTLVALSRWQASVGLPNTGFFGPLSRASLTGVPAVNTPVTTPVQIPVTIPSSTISTPASGGGGGIFTRNLTIGDTGTDVSSLQSVLIANGMLSIANPTGIFGPLTSAALAKWQAAQGLPSTGYFGPLSRAAVATNAAVGGNGGTISVPNPISSLPITTNPGTSATSTVPPVLIGSNTGAGGGGGGAPPATNPTPNPTPVPDPTPTPTTTPISTPPDTTPAPDVTPPTIALNYFVPTASITASDDVGVTKVELYVDGILRNTGLLAPYIFSVNTGILSNGTHTLNARAYDAAGNMTTAGNVSFGVNNPDVTAPSVPTGLTATAASSTRINLSWSVSSDAVGVTGYQIFRSGVLIGTATTNSYQNTGLSASITYSYTVMAYDAAGNVSGPSASASATTLPPPADTTAPTASITSPSNGSNIAGKVTVSVNASDNTGVSKVEFYVDGVLKNTTTSTPYNFSLDTSALTATTHSLSAKAYDAAGNIGTAGNVSVVVIIISPTVPTGLSVTGAATSTISLSWSPSIETGGSISGYKIFRGSTQIGTVAGTSFTDSGLTASTSYTYAVASYDPGGTTSANSNSLTTATQWIPLNYKFGFSIGEAWMGNSNTALLNQRMDDAASLGAGWLRIDMQWDHIQPSNPSSFNWTDVDRFVAAANAHHIKTLAILDYTPSWAAVSGCSNGDRCAPANPAQYAAFAQAAANRYTSQGVTAWEIWNEPNLKGSWQPAADAAAYSNFLKAAYTAIKNVNPSAVVITGGMGPAASTGGNLAPTDFLTQLYNNAAGSSFDAVGFHPYSYPAMPLYNATWNAWQQMANTSPSLRSIMTSNGDSAKQIWMTEYGAPTGGPGTLESSALDTIFANHPDHVTEALQAQMISDAIGYAKTASWAGPLFLYSYKDQGTSQSDIENFFGIIRNDASTKPSYQTFRSLVAQ